MRLVHYTDTPLQKIEHREQDKDRLYKPTGLWVSDEDEYGWREWCREENFHLARLTLAYEIILADDHDVLFLTSEQDVRQFTEDYKYNLANIGDRALSYIRWKRVVEEWDGLIVTPYQWDLRLDLDHMWYYAWDCASGCIWNPSAIKSFDTCQTAS